VSVVRRSAKDAMKSAANVKKRSAGKKKSAVLDVKRNEKNAKRSVVEPRKRRARVLAADPATALVVTRVHLTRQATPPQLVLAILPTSSTITNVANVNERNECARLRKR
jgi:hypothetical protein